MVYATSKGADKSGHKRSLIRAFASRSNYMNAKLLTKHHLEFLSLKGGCTGSSESTHVKMPHCWKYHALAHMFEKGANVFGFDIRGAYTHIDIFVIHRTF